MAWFLHPWLCLGLKKLGWKPVLKERLETWGRAHVMTEKSHTGDDCKVTPFTQKIVFSHFLHQCTFEFTSCFITVMPVQKKPAMKKPAAVMKTPAMKKPGGGKPQTSSRSDVRSGSNGPMPPMSDELLQLQAALDRSAQNPEILEQVYHALGEPEPGTPEMDPLQLAEMEQVLDEALEGPPTTPAAIPAPKSAAGLDSESSSWFRFWFLSNFGATWKLTNFGENMEKVRWKSERQPHWKSYKCKFVRYL